MLSIYGEIDMGTQPQFLYPTATNFPFDAVCSAIVHELEARNWSVEGIEVDFDEYGTGEEKYRHVSYVRGKDFKLWFGRPQRRLPGGEYNDIAAVTEVVIPHKEIHVYDDESGPRLYLYVGENWEKDRQQFMHGSKVNSKLNKERRMYLLYKGAWFLPTDSHPHYFYRGRRAPFLVHDNDLGREYEPKGSEPHYFSTQDVMEELEAWLRKHVYSRILQTPIPAEKVDHFVDPEPIPFPISLGALFTLGEYADASRIQEGRESIERLAPRQRYGLLGGRRLVSLDAANDGTIPGIAYDGFIWCGLGDVTLESSEEELVVHGDPFFSDRYRFLLRVTPKNANNIYIADMAGRAEYKQKLFEDNPDQERLTNAEYREFLRIPGRTIIPIHEYKGGYKQPVILINRELGLDEVEVLGDLSPRFCRQCYRMMEAIAQFCDHCGTPKPATGLTQRL